MPVAPTITVIIPTFNRKVVLQRALVSVFQQTREPDEVIVVDDGSTDQTEGMVKRQFPSTTYIKQDNLGVSAARNRGINAAQSDWLAFLDSDDEWLMTKLEKQTIGLNARPDCKICHSDEIWIRRGTRVNSKLKHAKSGGWMFQRCLPLCAISPSSVIIHRSIFTELGGFDEALPACEDYDFWLRVTSRFPVLLVDEPLIIKYGGHHDQLSRKHWGMDRFRIKALENILASPHLSPADEKAALNMLLQKLEIYLAGARKRDKSADVTQFECLYQKYKARTDGSSAKPPHENERRSSGESLDPKRT